MIKSLQKELKTRLKRTQKSTEGEFRKGSNEYDTLLKTLITLPSAHGLQSDATRSILLNQLLDSPASSYPTIHVTGSNGKGSVCTKIAKALEYSGYRVGLYTSPHLYDYRERIQINGEYISKEEVVLGLQALFALAKSHNLQPTFFEYTTLLALTYFKKAQVDIAIIEVGIGGRYDATCVINPLLSIITSISLEHTALLGKTVEEIAFQKAGIIKEGVPVVVGKRADCQALYKEASKKNSPLFPVLSSSTYFDEENQAIAKKALQVLSTHFRITPHGKKQGLLARPPCRFEQRGHVIFDVAHNPDAICQLISALHRFFPHKKYRFLAGFSFDKDYPACLSLIEKISSHIHLVQAEGSSRSTPLEHLCACLITKAYTAHSSVIQGFEEAYEAALSHHELLVVCGSFYIMNEIYRSSFNRLLT